MIPESEDDSEVEVLSRGFGNLKNIEGKVPASKTEEESDVDSEEEEINKEGDIKEEEPFPPKFGDLQSIRERCKALVVKIIDEMRHETLEETLVKLRRHTTTLSQPNPGTELLERDALKKPQDKNK